MRYIIIESSKFINHFSVYDTLLRKEIPCYNLATAKKLVQSLNANNSTFCDVCECDPCDCHSSEETYWKIIGDR